MKAHIDYYFYDCGKACTPGGCPGHKTDLPESLHVNGYDFVLDGHHRQDEPPFTDSPRKLDHWRRTLIEIVDAINALPPVEPNKALPDIGDHNER